MTTNYPSAYDTNTSGSLNNSKANQDPVVDVTYDLDATEWNTHADAILALERKVGDGSTSLTQDGDADEYNVREIMDRMCVRADRGFISEHFLFGNHATVIAEDINTAAAYDSTVWGASACGVAVITPIAAGAADGWEQTNEHFWLRGSYFRCRWYLSALPSTNGDIIELGLYNNANNYVMMRSVRAGGAWPDFEMTVMNAAASSSTTMTGSAPSATTWYVSEILTTASAATGFLDRAGQGAGTEYTATESSVPSNALAHFRFSVTSAVGGESMYCDMIGAGSTVIPL